MIMLTIFNPLSHFSKRVFQADCQLIKSMRFDKIHNFWNSKSTFISSNEKTLLLLRLKRSKLKRSKAKLVIIEPVSRRRVCSNTNSNEFDSDEIEKSRLAKRSVSMTMRIRTSWRFYHEWCQNVIVSHERWFQTKLYSRKKEDKSSKIFVLLHLKTAQFYIDLKKSQSRMFALWRAVLWRWWDTILEVCRIDKNLTIAVYANLNEAHIFTTVVANSWRVSSSDCNSN